MTGREHRVGSLSYQYFLSSLPAPPGRLRECAAEPYSASCILTPAWIDRDRRDDIFESLSNNWDRLEKNDQDRLLSDT
jgi:hypothetical protein